MKLKQLFESKFEEFRNRHFDEYFEPKQSSSRQSKLVKAVHNLWLWVFEDPSYFFGKEGRVRLADATATVSKAFPEFIYTGVMYRTLDFRTLPSRDMSLSDEEIVHTVTHDPRAVIAAWATDQDQFKGNNVFLIIGLRQQGKGLNLEPMFQSGENEVLAPYNQTVEVIARL